MACEQFFDDLVQAVRNCYAPFYVWENDLAITAFLAGPWQRHLAIRATRGFFFAAWAGLLVAVRVRTAKTTQAWARRI